MKYGRNVSSFGGLRVSERRLRLMMGLPINDGTLIRPVDSPFAGPVMYDWDQCISEALQRRPELRRQKWVVKQRELELLANKNFLRPQLDLVSRYRTRGFGQDLLGQSSAASNLWIINSKNGSWASSTICRRIATSPRCGTEFKTCISSRSRIVARARTFVHFGLSNAVAECKRSFENMNLQHKRLDAIVKQLNSMAAKSDTGETPELDVRLETHRRLLDARLRYYQSEVEYALALRNVNLEKGTLLEYCNVALAETMTDGEAYSEAAERRESYDRSKTPTERDPIIANSWQP